jgi:hypothetical protein
VLVHPHALIDEPYDETGGRLTGACAPATQPASHILREANRHWITHNYIVAPPSVTNFSATQRDAPPALSSTNSAPVAASMTTGITFQR